MSDRPVRYGMISLDAAPIVLLDHGRPLVFQSADETVEFARLHNIRSWMIFGDPEGWWPLYTQDGPVHMAPPPPARVDISLRGPRAR
jgi:hypothetical protein